MEYLRNLPFKQKALVGLFILLIVSIPLISFIVKQRTSFKSDASTNFGTQAPVTSTSTSSATLNQSSGREDIKKQIEALTGSTTNSSTSDDEEVTSAMSFGPTLKFRISLEGRNEDSQNAKVFVGLAEGSEAVSNPQYLLSFTPEVKSDGSFTGLSLAGLNIGSTYTAYLKGPTQIATSSAFVVKPAEANLNNYEALTMLTGDLNDDNKIDTEDYDILKSYLGTTSSSSGWKEDYDFNQDNTINLLDLGFILKNLNKVGAGSIYTSHVGTTALPITPSIGGTNASTSSSLKPPPSGDVGGYWLWVPKF